jgi:nucleoside-diphosphate-sugar epimerase
MTQTILVTGAQGLVGSVLIEKALDLGFKVRASSRAAPPSTDPRRENVSSGEITPDRDWMPVLRGIGTVIHCAARVHVMRENLADPLAAFRLVNTAGTLNLGRQAAVAGVKRFVFISSVKVNGEFSPSERGFSELDAAAPQDAYGVSKHEAEVGLRQLAAETGIEVVIVRPPLVYGAGVKANFAALMRAVGRGLPLPLGAVRNRRSLVALDNLVDFIMTCVVHPAAANQTFLVSDGCDLSTAELVRGMARAAGVPARLLPVPLWVLTGGAAVFRKGDALQRLCGNLQVDISKARSMLDWTPPASVDEGLRRAVLGIKQ